MSRSFLHELKRRNVVRAVVLYAGAVWALSQGISQLSPAIGLPDWSTRAFLIASAIGFPLWVAFAWFYELTPHGFRRDSEIAEDAPARRASARKLDIAIIGVLIVAVALLTSGYFIRGYGPGEQAAFHPPAGTIMVMPFANMSNDPQQAYFSSGITEELTNALGQSTGLTVIGWQTASRYADSKQTPQQIGRTLNISTILGGSIQRAGDTVRVSVELVSTVTGKQLWSAHYDDTLKNIFAVQDRISGAIAGTLKVRFAGARAAPTLDPRAHDLYLRGLAAMNGFTATGIKAAQGYYQQALQLDPDYADAWASLAYSWMMTSVIGSASSWQDVAPKLHAAAEKALALDPNNTDALVALAVWQMMQGHHDQGVALLQRVLKLDPSNVRAHQEYAVAVSHDRKQYLAQMLTAARLDPDNAFVLYVLETAYDVNDNAEKAVATALKLIKIAPHNVVAAFALASAYMGLNRGDDAVKAFDLVQPQTPLDQQLVDAGRLTFQVFAHPALRPEALAALGRLPRDQLHGLKRMKLIEMYGWLGDKQAAKELYPGFCADIPAVCGHLLPAPAPASASSS